MPSEKEIEAAMSGWNRALIDAPDESVYERRRRCIRAALEAADRVREDEPVIHARFETVDETIPITGSTEAPIKRVEQNDDGSYTVIIDHWPQPSGTDYFGSLVERARAAAAKASAKFPQPNYVTLKIAEEAGEVIRGAVHYAERRMEWSEVEGEIIQLLAMLIRFVTEGDQVNGIVPPTAGGGDE